MSKLGASKSVTSTVPVATPPSMISTQSAIYLINNKVQKLEEVLKLHMDDIEQKFGDHEAYVTDNIPDLDLINKALSDINTRLIDLEGLEARITALESGVKPASPPPATGTIGAPMAEKPAPKKKGTVKLADITAPPEIGISFS
jgi:hypothetical protein